MSDYFGDEFQSERRLRLGSGLTGTVKILLILNITIYAFSLLMYVFYKPALSFLFHWFALNPIEGISNLKIWQFVTYGFIHDVSPGHILMNMLFIFFFGPLVERHLENRKRFLLFYFGCLVVGGICQGLVGFWISPKALIFGASAAAIGIVVAAGVLWPNARIIFFIFPMKLKHLVMILVGIDIISALLEAGGPNAKEGTARLAHLAGAFFGFAYVKLIPKVKAYVAGARDRADTRVFKRMQSDEEELDRLLQKIHTWGMGSLTRRERKFLMDREKDGK